MKQFLLAAVAVILAVWPSASSAQADEPFARIVMTVGNTAIHAELRDTPTTRDFMALLPLTLPMTRWGDREYYGKPGKTLSSEGPQQNSFENGDVAYYVPGRSFAVFFDNTVNPDISRLIVMGTITSGLEELAAMGNAIEMRIDLEP